MDVLFLETLEFSMMQTDYQSAVIAKSREEVLRGCLARVGLELIDYGSWMAIPRFDEKTTVRVFSKAYRERAERETAIR